MFKIGYVPNSIEQWQHFFTLMERSLQTSHNVEENAKLEIAPINHCSSENLAALGRWCVRCNEFLKFQPGFGCELWCNGEKEDWKISSNHYAPNYRPQLLTWQSIAKTAVLQLGPEIALKQLSEVKIPPTELPSNFFLSCLKLNLCQQKKK